MTTTNHPRSSGEAISDALEQCLMALTGYLPAHRNAVTDAAIENARAALAQRAGTGGDAKDAARYRKLRARQWQTSHLFVVRGSRDAVRLGTYCPSFELLDEEVDALPDAAMGGETK